MKVSNNLDYDAADALAVQIESVINRNPKLTQGEVFFACMIVIADTLRLIQCRDCRKLAAKLVKKQMPIFIVEALARASGQADSTHRH